MEIEADSSLNLGALDIFRDEINIARSSVLQAEHPDSLARANAFVELLMPLLLEHLYDICKYSIATEYKSLSALLEQNQDAKQRLYTSYPQLKKQLYNCIQLWCANVIRLKNRWCKDKPALEQRLFSSRIGEPVAIVGEPGDPHDGGQQALVLSLSCGRKVVYKPRSLQLEEAFFAFCQQMGFSELYSAKFVTSESYGWMEHIAHVECESFNDINTFYFNAGLLLSVLYALDAADIHKENLIACGKLPIPVDLETLFHHADDSQTLVFSKLQQPKLGLHTVLKTGLIPQHLYDDARHSLSAFGLDMCQSDGARCLPKYAGKYYTVEKYVGQLTKGFEQGYQRFIERKADLLSEHKSNPLQLFSGASNRYVCRKTSIYSRLLGASYHPKFQVDDKQVLTLLDKLDIDLAHRPHLQQLIDCEKAAVLQGDIPKFCSQVSSRDLMFEGQIIVKNYFGMTGLQLSQFKISNMHHRDMLGQVRLIENCLSPCPGLPELAQQCLPSGAKHSEHKVFSAVTASIAQHIWQSRIPHQKAALFPVFSLDGDGSFVMELANNSMFDGFSGTLLFLAEYDALYPGVICRQELQVIAQSLLTEAVCSNEWLLGLPGFQGLAGQLYLVSRLHELWPGQQWATGLEQEIVQQLRQALERCAENDFLVGAAGAVLGLLAAHKATKCENSLELACDYGQLLVSRLPSGKSNQWLTFTQQKLCGFAHGLAGIGHALVVLGHTSEISAFKALGEELIGYEQQNFSESMGNWPDFRIEDEHTRFEQSMSAWCHGAIGIGISRMYLNAYLPAKSASLGRDISRALARFEYHQLKQNNALCHGNFGNLELLTSAREHSKGDSADIQAYLSLLTERSLALVKPNSTTSNPGRRPQNCSLMSGWAGIGYQLLRFCHTSKVANVLLLER